ncbi:MAG: hypothetical protein M1812_006894 [Candelaria pacifica]|nr:MAG: hypothetical protein M1812_006894 [Candelaria pacifica]
MPFNSFTVGTAVTPTVIETYISHYVNRKPLAQKPTAHISYHEGLKLIRQFLLYASHHTVEDIQHFTSQWVPCPHWVKVDEVTIPSISIGKAAEALQSQLGPKGIQQVGGKTWWQWRREGGQLNADWIEMRGDYNERVRKGHQAKRIMLYVHGGAYFFGSVDEHRYQLQRHARKLKARVFARTLTYDAIARYRLAPQFPFPCGLLDCLAAYLHLLTLHDPSEIVLAGDSAGGGMIVSMLVVLRDQALSLPAGAILISPWVDLTHSFPSVAGDGSLDYIPAHGFLHRPSDSWPPPNVDDMERIAMGAVEKAVGEHLTKGANSEKTKKAKEEAIQGFSVNHNPEGTNPRENVHNPAGTEYAGERPGNTIPGPGHNLSIMLDGNLVEIKDQIQMYATNQLISHPLVSPILQASLGGLPPLLILTGGGEMLRDEQIYLAHKAANPGKYPPGQAYLDEHPAARETISKWKGTDVVLQVWDDLCHVGPTLSFTRPAKFMYRSIAQFGAWALARAQKTEIEILDDDEVSIISSGSDSDSSDETANEKLGANGKLTDSHIGKAGDPLPPFRHHMIRERVSRHGLIYPLDPPSSLPALQMPASEIGVIKPGPVLKWMDAKQQWDTKYAREKRAVQKRRAKEMAQGYDTFGDDEAPPPSALAGRRRKNMPKEEKRKKSMGMSLWSLWGSSHDEKTASGILAASGAGARKVDDSARRDARSRSHRRTVTDTGQTTSYQDKIVDPVDEHTTVAEVLKKKEMSSNLEPQGHLYTPEQPSPNYQDHLTADDAFTRVDSASTRPVKGNVTYPFKLAKPEDDRNVNASTATLTGAQGVVSKKASQNDVKASG